MDVLGFDSDSNNGLHRAEQVRVMARQNYASILNMLKLPFMLSPQKVLSLSLQTDIASFRIAKESAVVTSLLGHVMVIALFTLSIKSLTCHTDQQSTGKSGNGH